MLLPPDNPSGAVLVEALKRHAAPGAQSLVGRGSVYSCSRSEALFLVNRGLVKVLEEAREPVGPQAVKVLSGPTENKLPLHPVETDIFKPKKKLVKKGA